jgi:hypothetical protein
MLNLFILVIIQQFETYYVTKNNPIEVFTGAFDDFHREWVLQTQRFKCVKIKQKQLLEFFKRLPHPLGFKTGADAPMMDDNEANK